MSEAHTLEVLAQLTGLSTQVLVSYQEQGIIQPQYDDDTVRRLRRIEHLRESCEMNLEGLRLMARLLDEVEFLRDELRRRR
jgi:DNA-binding transcriptional MerR regulator